ncbi:HSP20-like chaperone, partial [Dimargaris cristalligena]
PEVLWAQRSDVIYLTINQPDVSVKVLEITPTNIKFEGVNDQTTYSFDLDFFAEIDPEASKKSVSARSIFLILAKKDQEEPYWPRLQKVKGKLSYLKTDFGKWKDEDDDDEEEAGAGGAGGMPNFDGMDFSSMAGGAGGMPD